MIKPDPPRGSDALQPAVDAGRRRRQCLGTLLRKEERYVSSHERVAVGNDNDNDNALPRLPSFHSKPLLLKRRCRDLSLQLWWISVKPGWDARGPAGE